MKSLFTSLFRRRSAPSGDIPTVDLYFPHAMGDMVGEGLPIRRLGPYTFATDRRLVIIRYLTAEELDVARARSRLVYLGTRSHVDSLPLLETLAREMARRVPGTRLTLFCGNHLPRSMQRHPAIDNRAPLAWPEFRRLLRSERYDVALAPLGASPFNTGRSPSKVLDHALIGAAGIYSDRAPYASVIDTGHNGLLANDAVTAWILHTEHLLSDGQVRLAIASAGIALANQIGNPIAQRTRWQKWLSIG